MLQWKRILDCYHNDKPAYEYEAITNDGKRFHIYNASDVGFGLSAYDTITNKSLTNRSGIVWLRTLKRCKNMAEVLNSK